MFTISRPLKNGTTVTYENKIGQIISSNKINFSTIRLFNTSQTITIEKKKLKTTPHDKWDLIKYYKAYYLISNIYFDNDILKYEIDYINKYNSESKHIDAYHSKITTIEKQKQEKTISILKFIDRYNSTINYLNKKLISSKFKLLDIDDTEEYMKTFFERCKFKMCQLNKLEQNLKKSQKFKMQINFIYENPFNFITEEYQLITFEKAEYICEEFMLDIDFEIKCKAWTYDLFLNKTKSFYIKKSDYDNYFEKFCSSRNKNHKIYYPFINSFMIDKRIDSEDYKTTNYLLKIEKDMTDLMIDLFNGEEFDFNIDDIDFEINRFEESKSNPNKKYSLEKEQKEAVRTGIINYCSILTGPPGTGKTTIVSCILYVLNELYKKNKENKNYENDNEENNENDDEESKDYDDESKIPDKYINPKNISLMAPTGLAFINLSRGMKFDHYNKDISGTCHKTLYQTCESIINHQVSDCDECCNKTKKCIYKNKIKHFIIDEVSMIDSLLFYEILKMCKKFKARLIIIGDVQQLPSISAGTVLKNIINSSFYETTKLINIKRQNSGSLVNSITKMSKNELITQSDFSDDSISLLSTEIFLNDDKINIESISELISQNRLNKNNTKFVAPFKNKKFKFNVNNINNIIQKIFNPCEFDFYKIPSNNKYEDEFEFCVKDKIVRTENEYGENFRANGEEAEIISYLCSQCEKNECTCCAGKKIIIKYSGQDEKEEEISIDKLYEEFALNYAVTIHKSQGSQYDNVVLLIEPNISFLEKASVYTAISRSREKCIIISTPNDFNSCQKTNNTKKVSLFMRISDKYEDELPDYSECSEIRYYLEISYDNKNIAKENNCIFDKEKKAWYTLDNKIYELFKSIPLLKKQKAYEQREFIKKNGGRWCKETKMWYTYNSNELLKEFM